MGTLEEFALTNIAVYLWSINPLPHIENENDWFQMEKNIKEKVKIASGIELPVFVADKLSNLVRIVGHEIFKFMSYLYVTFKIDDTKLKRIVSRSCWKIGGLLDSTKTINKAIQSEELCEIRKFQLASYFCIESCIQESWSNLSDYEKTAYLTPTNVDLTIENIWAFTLTNQEHRFEDTLINYNCQCINEYIIINLVEVLNVDTIKLFLKKISENRKQIVLESALQNIHELSVYLRHVPSFHICYANVNSLIVYLFSLTGIEDLEERLDNPIPTS